MKLKKICLNNIRSYVKEKIIFPEGSVLLSGDIGAGKTSILLAIEFALFGLQPGQKGNALLKNGKEVGGVTLEFEVEGKNIFVERTLKRKKSISQEYCAITIDDEKTELSVTELKSRVLELLSYPKEFSKKQNILYKFTVYTPQEDMKQIILQDSETRINTLRHVFGIDKYKKIIENTSIVISKVKEKKKLKEGYLISLDENKEILILKEQDLENKKLNLSSLEKELFIKREIRLKFYEEVEEISKKIEEKRTLQQELEKINIGIINKKEQIQGNNKLILQLENQIGELKSVVFDESKILLLEQDLDRKRKEKIILDEENLKISSEINSLNHKNKDYENTKERLKHLEMCPTCLQNVDSVYKSNVINKMDSDSNEVTKKIGFLDLEKKKLIEKINKINFEISNIQKEISDSRVLKVRYQGMKEKEDRISDLRNSNRISLKDIELLTGQINLLKNSIAELSIYDRIYEEKKKLFEESQKEEKIVEIKLAEIKKEIEVFSKQIDELKEKISKGEKIKKELKYLSELEDWLSKKFLPVISFVEKNVMIKLKSEFSNLFSKWFCMLVSDNFNVRLNDDFTPIIEQQDYELNYAYLSGGERTAIALAYRLALNQIINSVMSTIKTKDLVILDEPTDGFSEQQLDKMRDVLEELDVAQLIIVSHEQKIEGFVDNVIKFKKENGISGKE